MEMRMGSPILEFWEQLVKDLGRSLELPPVGTLNLLRAELWGRGWTGRCLAGPAALGGRGWKAARDPSQIFGAKIRRWPREENSRGGLGSRVRGSQVIQSLAVPD